MPGPCNGVFALTFNEENEKTFNLDGELPKQTLTLETIHIRNGGSLTDLYTRVELPFISSSSIMNSGNTSRLLVPVPDQTLKEISMSPGWKLDMKHAISGPFTVRLYNSAGSLINATGLKVVLVFSFEYAQF